MERFKERTERRKMKILFYGAGVMGSLYAARLQDSGQEVSVLVRRQRLADIREHGIVLDDMNTGSQSTVRVNVVEQLDSQDAYDLVVVIMPKNQISEIFHKNIPRKSEKPIEQ